MKVAIVLNGKSSGKKLFYKSILPAISSKHATAVFETQHHDHAITLSRDAANTGTYNVVFAAGGDGTLNQVVNGILTSQNNGTCVGLIPLGSGNDFARTVQVHADPSIVLALLDKSSFKTINVGEVKFTSFSNGIESKLFVNVADIGMGPEVVWRVAASPKFLGSQLAYYFSILKTFVGYKTMTVTAETREWRWEGKLRSLAIANGKYYGHGLCIAPEAKVDDNMLDVFICGNVSVLDFVVQSENLKKGKVLKLAEVFYKHTTEIHLTSEAQCLVEGDGEVFGTLPATVRLSAHKINMLC